MATRSRTTFKKRQKELARMEKQRDKAARRLQRKKEKQLPHDTGDAGETPFNPDEETVVADESSDQPSAISPEPLVRAGLAKADR